MEDGPNLKTDGVARWRSPIHGTASPPNSMFICMSAMSASCSGS
jgi:hypothetical protein